MTDMDPLNDAPDAPGDPLNPDDGDWVIRPLNTEKPSGSPGNVDEAVPLVSDPALMSPDIRALPPRVGDLDRVAGDNQTGDEPVVEYRLPHAFGVRPDSVTPVDPDDPVDATFADLYTLFREWDAAPSRLESIPSTSDIALFVDAAGIIHDRYRDLVETVSEWAGVMLLEHARNPSIPLGPRFQAVFDALPNTAPKPGAAFPPGFLALVPVGGIVRAGNGWIIEHREDGWYHLGTDKQVLLGAIDSADSLVYLGVLDKGGAAS